MRLTIQKKAGKSGRRNLRKTMRNVGHMLTALVLTYGLITPTGLLGSYKVTSIYGLDLVNRILANPEATRRETSPYDSIIRRHSKKNGLDWRLVLAIVHTESHFNDEAVSKKGARGLMQIMPIVAKDHNAEFSSDPDANIALGVKHFVKVSKRIKGRRLSDKLKLSIAAYNAGLSHLRDAQILTRKLGKNPFKWNDVKEGLLMLENPLYYKEAKYGYCKGTETVNYVEKVLQRYQGYKNRYPKNAIILANDHKKDLTHSSDA